MTCKIDKALILSSCTDVAVAGTSGRMWLFNYDDWKAAEAGAGITVGTDGEITAIDLTAAGTGAQSWRWESPQGTITTGHPFTDNTAGISGFMHMVVIILSDLSQDMKKAVASLANFNKCIAIVETNAAKSTSDSKSPGYVAFGLVHGLKLNAVEGNLSDPNAGNALTVTLQTPGNTQLELALPTNVAMTTAAMITTETPISP